MYNVQISKWSKVKAPFCVALLGPVPRTSLNQIEAECQKKCFEAEIFVITQTKILKILKITLPNIYPHIRNSKSI